MSLFPYNLDKTTLLLNQIYTTVLLLSAEFRLTVHAPQEPIYRPSNEKPDISVNKDKRGFIQATVSHKKCWGGSWPFLCHYLSATSSLVFLFCFSLLQFPSFFFAPISHLNPILPSLTYSSFTHKMLTSLLTTLFMKRPNMKNKDSIFLLLL